MCFFTCVCLFCVSPAARVSKCSRINCGFFSYLGPDSCSRNWRIWWGLILSSLSRRWSCLHRVRPSKRTQTRRAHAEHTHGGIRTRIYTWGDPEKLSQFVSSSGIHSQQQFPKFRSRRISAVCHMFWRAILFDFSDGSHMGFTPFREQHPVIVLLCTLPLLSCRWEKRRTELSHCSPFYKSPQSVPGTSGSWKTRHSPSALHFH